MAKRACMEGMGSHREVRGDVEARVVGPAPLIGAVCDQIGLVEVVDSMTRWDRRQCKLSPGQRIKALVLNILSGRRPLYKVANFFKDTDVELLLGKGVGAEDLGDVALGRALDKLVKAGPKAIYSAVAARAVLLEQVDTTFVHWDSTSRSVYGEYADTNGTLELVHGYSKDHRPDLRQFLMALLCNREGIPVWAKIQNGNTSDKRGNQEAIDELLATLTPERLRETVYVADAALLTTANLRIMDQAGLRFISRLPETFAACTQAKRAAFAAGRWEDLGVLAQNPRPTSASYRVSEQTGMIDGRTYRLVVVHSNQLDAGKEKRLQKDVADERVELTRELNALAQEEFACEADARKAAAAWLKTHAQTWHPVTFTFSARMVTDRRPRRGRPRKDELAPTRTVYHAAGQLGAPDPERLQAERERRSCFVLITDLKDALRYDARRLLRVPGPGRDRNQIQVPQEPHLGATPCSSTVATALKLWRTFWSSRALSTPLSNAVLAAPCAPPERSSTSLASERPPSPPPNHCWRCSPISLSAVPPAPPPPLPACSSLQPICGIEPIPSSASSASLSTCTAPFPNSPAVHKSLLTASEGVEDVCHGRAESLRPLPRARVPI